MPVVPTVQGPSVSYQPAQGPRARALPGDNSIANALAGVATMFQQAQKEKDTTLAEEALVQFEREKNSLLFNPENGYLNLKGKGAMEGAGAVNDRLLEMQKQYAKDLSPEAQRLFNRAASAHVTNGQSKIMAHAATEQKSWQAETYKAEMENKIENAALMYNSPEDLARDIDLGAAAVKDRAALLGLDSRQTKEAIETFRSDFYSTAIAAAITQKDLGTARAMLADKDIVRQIEGDDLVKLKGKMAEESDKAEIAGATIAIRGDGSKTLTEMQEEARSQYPNDPVKQQRLVKAVSDAWKVDELAKKERQQTTYDSLAGQVEGGARYEDLPAEAVDALTTAHRDDLKKRSKAMLEGKSIAHDSPQVDALQRILLMPPAELAKLQMSDLYRHFPMGMSSESRKQIESALKSAKEGVLSPQQEAATGVESRITELTRQLSSKKMKSTDPEFLRRQSALRYMVTVRRDQILERKRQAGDKSPVVTPSEMNDIAADLMTHISYETPGIFGTRTDSIDLRDVPADAIVALRETLRYYKDSLGDSSPVTTAEMLHRWRQLDEKVREKYEERR